MVEYSSEYSEGKYYAEILEKKDNYSIIDIALNIWSNKVNNYLAQDKNSVRISDLEERISEVERKLALILSTGIKVEPMEVPDFPEEEIKGCKDSITEYLSNHDSINPWKYAEEKKFDVRLVLTCIDELISDGKLGW